MIEFNEITKILLFSEVKITKNNEYIKISTSKINNCKRLFNIVRILIQNKLKILKNKVIFLEVHFFYYI